MTEERKFEMQCAEFDRLLSDAIDGALAVDDQARFEAHRQECVDCAALFASVAFGHELLGELEEVEAPHQLIHNILAATSRQAATGMAAEPAEPLAKRLQMLAHAFFAPLWTPRFAGACAMAFFSITLMINMFGVRPGDLRARTLSRSVYAAENRVIRYYENLQFVYQLQQRVRSFHQPGAAEPTKQPSAPQNGADNMTPTPRQNDEAQMRGDQLAAAATFDLGGLEMRRRNQ